MSNVELLERTATNGAEKPREAEWVKVEPPKLSRRRRAPRRDVVLAIARARSNYRPGRGARLSIDKELLEGEPDQLHKDMAEYFDSKWDD